ncbi:hypothetical protein GRX01_10175 [Halobaculum sp. WSA2]|uniref:Uncharacterized protein n=2 Tax=Haloferacaceae TaxID=1644056 RepID=A0A6B0SZE6_9EURY|nr:hypothetical protein [Halobaculum saliterrae]
MARTVASAGMAVVDTLIDAVAANPGLTIILVVLLALVFGAYLFIRRIVVNVAEGYDQGRQ